MENFEQKRSDKPFSWNKAEGGGISASKENYFAWARQWTFAKKDASAPQDYVYAVRCNIQDQAAAGFMIDVVKSAGDELVYKKVEPSSLSDETAEALAKQVLGV